MVWVSHARMWHVNISLLVVTCLAHLLLYFVKILFTQLKLRDQFTILTPRLAAFFLDETTSFYFCANTNPSINSDSFHKHLNILTFVIRIYRFSQTWSPCLYERHHSIRDHLFQNRISFSISIIINQCHIKLMPSVLRV